MDDETNVSSDLRGARGSGDESPGTLELSDGTGYVGDSITLRGRELPAGEQFEVVWHTSEGQWGVLEANEVVGPQYQPRLTEVATVRTDDAGAFETEWQIPEDYGGTHRIDVQTPAGKTVASASFEVTPWFELDRREVPLGEAATLRAYGLGPDVVTSNYQVAWDNGVVGFVTGVQNRGTATARIRAVGPPGEHVLQVWRNADGVPYLQNNTQSRYGPVAGERQSAWTLTVTEPDESPRKAWVDPLLDESPIATHYPDVEATDATLTVEPQSGKPGTTVFVTGEAFPPDSEVDLRWYRHEGQRGEGAPITPEPDSDVLPTATTDGDGRFQAEVAIPRDQGGTRPITASVDGREVAVTGFVLQPSVETFVPVRGPVGTTIEIELTGVGWTAYENRLFLVYDNKALGYAVGNTGDDEPGTVRLELQAAGRPGWHFVDVYPGIMETREDRPEFTTLPHLSYLDNHPGRPLPALHFAFEVTEG